MALLPHSTRSNQQAAQTARTVARGLGWFSIGLGLAECLMPEAMARRVGLEGKESVLRAYGLREIASGVGILMSRDPEPWVRGRVLGDAIDLGTLTTALRRDNANRVGTGVAMLAVAQVTAIDYACANALAKRSRTNGSRPLIDYSDRSGFPKPPEEMRGVALKDFDVPPAYRIPEALRPWGEQTRPESHV
jgi:hypothetical protein